MKGWIMWIIYSIAVCAIMASFSYSETLHDIAKRIPTEFDGWRAEGDWRHYDRNTLFQHIDGGAELYLAYRFKGAFVRRYLKGGEMGITVDIYDMSSPEDAFGVFSVECYGDEVGIGQGSDYIEGLLRFWKGRFFVSILTRLETDESKAAVLKLGRLIDRAISDRGEPPKILSLLPVNGLKRRSVRFFRKHSILNRIYFIADKNVLRLGDETEGVVAEYERKDGKGLLLIVRYSSAKDAKAALNGFINALIPEAKRTKIARLEDGRWIAVEAVGQFLFAALDATKRGFAHNLIETMRGILRGVKG
ncbi:MAG: DUF6599 family protein [Armatimonadota bacterium]|nr:hypothetical protein [Armatimonadota bacterium]MCX7777294.1 hypothetical protein [Armatimonadota bacterium]MDW8024389.1 DUF6599 family protein [Armatimonadota bacterium]